MANFLRTELIVRGTAVLAVALLGVAQAAAPPCANPQIVIDAKPAEVDYRNNHAVLRDVVITQCDMRIEAREARVTGGLDLEDSRWTISGDVRITAEGGRLRSDKAVVWFRNNLVSQATITGTPAEFEQLRADGSTSRGRANVIDYQTTNGTVSLKEDAWLMVGCNEITGQQLVYNIRAQNVQAQAQPNADDRIRITIPGKRPAGSACVEPAAGGKP